MKIHPLETEAEYDMALKAIADYFEKEPAPGSPAADHFDLLAILIANYEDGHWPIASADPAAATV